MLLLWARVDLRVMAMKGYSAFPKLQHCWNLTIRLFRVRTLVGVGGLTLCREAVSVLYSPSRLGYQHSGILVKEFVQEPLFSTFEFF